MYAQDLLPSEDEGGEGEIKFNSLACIKLDEEGVTGLLKVKPVTGYWVSDGLMIDHNNICSAGQGPLDGRMFESELVLCF